MRLESIVNELTTYLPDHQKRNLSISNSTIGWQIEHILLTINQVLKNCEESIDSNYQPKFSIWKLIVFTTKKIPRGKVKAPKIVRPELFDKNSLEIHIKQTTENLKIINDLKKNQYFNHPIFGHINKIKMIKFLEIHSNHHLKIIREIIHKTS
jgi:hypothetical protein